MHPQVKKIPWSRKWQPTPVFLLGESPGQRNLEGYHPWGHKESDLTEHAHHVVRINKESYLEKASISELGKLVQSKTYLGTSLVLTVQPMCLILCLQFTSIHSFKYHSSFLLCILFVSISEVDIICVWLVWGQMTNTSIYDEGETAPIKEFILTLT